MMAFLSRIVYLSVIFIISFSNIGAAENIDLLIRRGLDNCYHFRWKSAENDFNRIIINNPEDPRGYHYLSGIYLWYYLSSGNSSDLNSFLKYSDMAVNKGEKLIDRNSGSEKLNYILGNAYSYRTLGYAKSESYINAIWASKKSEKYLKKVIEINPDNFDAYLGLGLYNFAAAQIPSAFKWALALAGISGDEETGIRYIELAASRGDLSKVEAQYYLCQLLSGVLFDYKSAGEISGNLLRKYPSNILFSYARAVVYLKEKNPEGAEKLLKNIVVSSHGRFIQVISFSNFLLGDVHFRKNDFSNAILYYDEFLRMTKSNDYTGIAALRLGMSYDMNDDLASAKRYYENTSRGNTDIEDDLFARRTGELLKKAGMERDEKLLLQYVNMLEAGRFKQAHYNLSVLADSTKNGRIKAEANYYLSEAAFLMGKFEESVRYALIGGESDSGNDNRIKAYSYYNAARGSKALGKGNEMMKYIEKAEEMNNGDYRNQLKNLIKSLSRREVI
jgi:tetratricopeptide (TPR) repeat protein